MVYSAGAHGWWCNARTYPTRCQYCRAEVFYFSCDCGSKVFFDSLGWPWPIHDCTEHLEAQRQIRLEQEYTQRMAERQVRRRRLDMPIRASQPQEDAQIEEIGIVREIVPTLDVFKKFRLPRNASLVIQLLGELATTEFVQVTIHAGDLNSEHLTSYTFLAEREAWERLNAVRGDLLSFAVLGKSLPGHEPYWLCTDISRPGR